MKTAVNDARSSASLTTLSRTAAGSASHEIPRPRSHWKTRVLLPTVVFLAFGMLMAYAARDLLIPTVDVYVVPVIAKAGVSETASSEVLEDAPAASTPLVLVQAPGWIEPDPYSIIVPALVNGIVKEVLVLEGDQVEAGQIVARLIDEDFQIAVRSARAIVQQREADLSRAQAAVEAAEAGVLVEEAYAAALRDEVIRKRELITAGSVGSAEVRRLELQLQGLEARVAQARSNVIEAKAAASQAEAVLVTARISLADAELQLSRTEIRSPCNGTVLTRFVEPGSHVAMPKPGETSGMAGAVVRLYDPTKLQVRVDVPLADAAKVGIGTVAEITTETLPNDTFWGTVSRIVHEANIQRNSVQYKVSINDPSPLLKPEMLCRVRFHVRSTRTQGDGQANAVNGSDASGLQLFLPSDALINRQENSAQVWVAENQSSMLGAAAVLREVVLGGQDGKDTVILSGVKPGDRVIVNPPSNLKNGTRVRIVGEAVAPAHSE